MLIREFFKRSSVGGDIGIEVEVEGGDVLPKEGLPTPWVAKADHSLRGLLWAGNDVPDPSSMEYVTATPISASLFTKKSTIKGLTDLLSKKSLKVNPDSPRTSVHVHVNVQELTPLQVWTSVFAYWLAENTFVEYCGDERKGNMFCLRLQDAEGVLKFVEADLDNTSPFSSTHTDAIRYCGLNLKAITSTNSLEFRSMRGTTDPEIIDNWTTMVYDVVQKASGKWTTPEECLDYFWKYGATSFISSLTSWGNRQLLTKPKDWADGMKENAGIISNVVYSTNWEAWAKAVEADYAKRKNKPKPTAWETIATEAIAGAPTTRTLRRAQRRVNLIED